MSIADEVFYVRQLSQRLKLFREVGKNHFRFRCPLCGDSKISEFKSRGGIFARGEKMMYGCFNCGASTTFSAFLKEFDPLLFKEMMFDKFKGNNANNYTPDEHKEEIADIPQLLNLDRVFPVSLSPRGKEYLKSRYITNLSDIYVTKDAHEIISKFRPETKNVENFLNKEAIVFPLMTMERAVYGLQMRFFEGEFRYMTIMVDRRFAKLFGSHRVNIKKEIWVTEGIFDSYMLDNSVANLDASLHMASDKMKLPKSQFVLVYDNEPRNREVMKMMSEGVKNDFKVFFWPEGSSEFGKDLNEIRSNNPKMYRHIKSKMNDYVFQGLQAKLRFKDFKY